MAIKKRVAFLPAATDGCSFYRMFLPHLRTPGSQFHVCPPQSGIPSNYLNNAQVAVVQRQLTEVNLQSIQKLKEKGIKVIYDLDDNFWSLPNWNKAKDFLIRQGRNSGVVPCMEACDIITTSTPFLKRVVERHLTVAKQVISVDNAIDFNLFGRTRPFEDRGYITIGWAGSTTHSGDLEEMALPALIEVATTRSDVRIGFMGNPFPSVRRFAQQHPDKIKFYPTVTIHAYPAWFSNLDWDVCIAPLVDCEFNRSKSAIKMLESALIGVPCLASDIENYRAFCETDPRLLWLLCSTHLEWVRKLNALADDKSLRGEFADRMLARVRQRYDMNNKINEWFEIFNAD